MYKCNYNVGPNVQGKQDSRDRSNRGSTDVNRIRQYTKRLIKEIQSSPLIIRNTCEVMDFNMISFAYFNPQTMSYQEIREGSLRVEDIGKLKLDLDLSSEVQRVFPINARNARIKIEQIIESEFAS